MKCPQKCLFKLLSNKDRNDATSSRAQELLRVLLFRRQVASKQSKSMSWEPSSIHNDSSLQLFRDRKFLVAI